ncbi:MAG: hypothetical protein JO023_01235 [Chloroflexi bacterium]|nr:hypothetical protein [Chloroflexota bacterium]
MQRYVFKLVPTALALAIVAAFSLTGLAAADNTSSSNCGYVALQLFNPEAGVQVPSGPLLITGSAQDIRAGNGNGISSVQLFLGRRENGGTFLGNASFSSQSGTPNTFFSLNAGIPDTNLGPQQLQVIATSAEDSHDYEIFVPFTIANPAFPKNTGGSATSLPALCAPGGSTASGSAQTGGTISEGGPVLNVINPQPRTSLLTGPVGVSGTAYDRQASSGSGVDGVQIFLDNRDSGGTFLANAMMESGGPNSWQATISLPTNNTGVHALYFYAKSSVTGKETVVSVPITASN